MSTLSGTSDIELVRELARRLELGKTEEQESPHSHAYYDGPNKNAGWETAAKMAFHSPQHAPEIIVLGCGIGYSNFAVEFYFENDKLLGHGVWE